MKLVIDTDVLVAALRSRSGASAELLRLADIGRCTFVMSVPLVLEYEAVVTRAKHLAAANLTSDEALTFVDTLLEMAVTTGLPFRYRPLTKDPGDELVVETAINGTATAIVTFNRRHYGTAPAMFGIGCWLPREALERLR